MLDCTSSREIWGILEEIYATQNLATVMNFKKQLRNLKECIAKIERLADSLKAVGEKVPAKDHIIF